MCIVKILNCNVQSLTTKELLEELDEGVLITPNLDHLVNIIFCLPVFEAWDCRTYSWKFILCKILYVSSE